MKTIAFAAAAACLLLTACMTPLHKAAGRGDVAEIKRLIAAGADPNAVNEGLDRWTPLASAAAAGQAAAAQALLEGGADPLFRPAAGTARQIALQFGHPDVAAVIQAYEDRKLGRVARAARTAASWTGATPASQTLGEAPPDPGGRIGLAIASRKDGAFIIQRVLPGSPAAEAGIAPGDRIVAVDGKPVGLLTLAQTVAELRGAPGAALDLTLQKGSEPEQAYHLVRWPASGQTTAAAPFAATAPAFPSAPAFSSDVDAPRERLSPREDDYALVIGIESYQSVPKADYGLRDARAVRAHLEALGWPARNIVSLEGSAATGNKLKSYLQEWLPLNVKPDTTLFVYYSGHGAPDPLSGDAYLVPWDGDPKFLKSTAYPLKQFYAELGKLKVKRVVVALDACFSGAGGRSVLAKGARPLVVKVADGVPAAENLTVLAAASGDEITGTLDDQGHGMFTYYLLKGLSGAAKTPDGAVTPDSLFRYLSPKVEDEARRQNREQTPTFSGRGGDRPLFRD